MNGKKRNWVSPLHQRKSRRGHATAISNLYFADDIALLANDIDQTRMIVNRVEEECKKVGLEINAKKTKSVFFNRDSQVIITDGGIQIKQNIVESTGEQDFKYFGSWCDQKRDIESGLDFRRNPVI